MVTVKEIIVVSHNHTIRIWYQFISKATESSGLCVIAGSFRVSYTLIWGVHVACSGPWTQSSGWTGPIPVVYRNFEDLTGMTLVNGAEIVPGKVTVL